MPPSSAGVAAAFEGFGAPQQPTTARWRRSVPPQDIKKAPELCFSSKEALSKYITNQGATIREESPWWWITPAPGKPFNLPSETACEPYGVTALLSFETLGTFLKYLKDQYGADISLVKGKETPSPGGPYEDFLRVTPSPDKSVQLDYNALNALGVCGTFSSRSQDHEIRRFGKYTNPDIFQKAYADFCALEDEELQHSSKLS